MLKLDVSNISPRSDREATAGTLFQFIVYRKGQDQRWPCPNCLYRILSAERFQRKETDSY